jgi:hypothetical protein
MVAFILDRLPGGMELLNSSLMPSDVGPGQVSWTIIDLKPGETKTIDYMARVPGSGAYVNQAHIEVYSVDGPDSASADVMARVETGGAINATLPQPSGWQPPACFGLNCTEQGYNDDWVPCYTCGAPEG